MFLIFCFGCTISSMNTQFWSIILFVLRNRYPESVTSKAPSISVVGVNDGTITMTVRDGDKHYLSRAIEALTVTPADAEFWKNKVNNDHDIAQNAEKRRNFKDKLADLTNRTANTDFWKNKYENQFENVRIAQNVERKRKFEKLDDMCKIDELCGPRKWKNSIENDRITESYDPKRKFVDQFEFAPLGWRNQSEVVMIILIFSYFNHRFLEGRGGRIGLCGIGLRSLKVSFVQIYWCEFCMWARSIFSN